jgi:cytidylate kinase
MTSLVVAVDGPAAAGKGELTRRLARHFNLARLDTGLLYRAVGWAVLQAKLDPADESAALAKAQALAAADLENPDLRSEAAGSAASKVAAIPAVRTQLVDFQRNFAKNPPGRAQGAVLDGRDIGTVICPDASAKLFLTASAEIRAERRLKELQAKGVEAIRSAVLRDMMERDARDAQRSVAPLEPAKDAFVLDTSDLDADAVFAAAVDFISRKIA